MKVTSDVDGSNITSLILCFFLLFMRQIIDDGKLFKALPPLYVIDKKNIKKFYNGQEWLFDKNELYDIFNTIIVNNIEIFPMEMDKYVLTGNKTDTSRGAVLLKKSEAKAWLRMNAEYLLELENLVKRASANPYIVEYVCFYKLVSLGDDLVFKKLIEKKFPECSYDMEDFSLYGSFKGENVSLIADTLFMKMAKRYLNLLSANIGLEVLYVNKNDKEDGAQTVCTIGQFLTDMNKSFDIKILQRLKGLGESDPDALFVTTINPKMRKLIKLSIDNLQEAFDIFELLHGKSAEMREKRRDLLEKTEISYADIDN